MRRAAAVVAVLVVALAGAAAPATGTPSERRLREARAEERRAERRVARIDGRLEARLERFRELRTWAGRAASRLLAALLAERAAEEALVSAQARLDARASLVYQLGPAGPLEALLGARSFAEVSDVQAFAFAALHADAHLARDLAAAEAALARRRRRAEAARRALAARERRLRGVVERLRRDLEAARARAAAAGHRVDRLERLLAELAEAEAASWDRLALLAGDAGVDQSALLALLGATGGRTCEVPAGLRDTGRDVDGLASWYGWGFAGRTTASGAIFDPRLFTAAHRTLPFGVFLRVSYRGRCAIVLVNDRGPYVEGRVIDLSMAAARYLGVGVSPVHADVLVPR